MPIAGAAGAAGVVAAAGAVVMGLTPTIAASPALMSDIYYVPGTKIGTVLQPPQSEAFALAISKAAGQPHTEAEYHEIVYPASIAPFSTGGLNDPTWNDSVATGLTNLTAAHPHSGDTVTGYSQGAVVATEYKRANPGSGINYVLVENPNRPNGGVLERFDGLTVPILNITFNGATPVNDSPTATGHTVDISRQYDGWSDFPAYPLNVLADANAIAGIYYLHGSTQGLDDTALNGLKTPTNNIYYQSHGDTEYYLIPTDELPILMPLNGIVPDSVLKALDPPLRYLVELGYDRADYSTPTPAGLVPNLNPATVASGLAAATVQGVEAGLAGTGVAAPAISSAKAAQPPAVSTPTELGVSKALPKPDLPKVDVPKLIPPKRGITSSPLSNTLTAPTATTKAGHAGPIKSIQSAIKSLSKNLAPKAKPVAAKGPAGDS